MNIAGLKDRPVLDYEIPSTPWRYEFRVRKKPRASRCQAWPCLLSRGASGTGKPEHAIIHGNRRDACKKMVLNLQIRKRIRLQIIDEGPGSASNKVCRLAVVVFVYACFFDSPRKAAQKKLDLKNTEPAQKMV